MGLTQDRVLAERARDRESEAFAELDRAESAYQSTVMRIDSLRVSILTGESSVSAQTIGGISAVITFTLLTLAFFAVSWFAQALTAFPRGNLEAAPTQTEQTHSSS